MFPLLPLLSVRRLQIYRISSTTTKLARRPLSNGPLHQRYETLIAARDVEADPHQLKALDVLEDLRLLLMESPPPSVPDPSTASSSSSSSSWSTFWSSAKTTAVQLIRHSPKGAYLHGGTGCGKTFLMDLFYESIDQGPWAEDKQKVHFNKFMLRVHQAMHQARYGSDSKTAQPDAILPSVIDSTAARGRLICLDEFQVTDVADALILQRLFTGLWDKGCVLVATSNRPPDDLYKNGLQRDRFIPFIKLLQKRCEIVDMRASDIDYRLLQKQSGVGAVYFTSADSLKDFDRLFYHLAGSSAVAPTYVRTQGRHVPIAQAVLAKGLARFTFEDLCTKALGAADYLMIGQNFHTVFVERIPILSLNEINWVRRFITFIDCMYESKVKLVLQAKTPPSGIFERPPGDDAHDEVFAFDRTLSRLEEMASAKYLQRRWVGAGESMESSVRFEPSLSDDRERK